MVLKTKTYDVGSSSESDDNNSIENEEKQIIKPQKEMVFEIDEDDSEDENIKDEEGEGEW